MVAEFGTGQVFWSLLWFALVFLWIYSVVIVFGDIFRSDDLAGSAKAAWSLGVFFAPFVGVFVYLIVRGDKVRERSARDALITHEQHANIGERPGRPVAPDDVARTRMR